jgi:hypothetical protein
MAATDAVMERGLSMQGAKDMAAAFDGASRGVRDARGTGTEPRL